MHRALAAIAVTLAACSPEAEPQQDASAVPAPSSSPPAVALPAATSDRGEPLEQPHDPVPQEAPVDPRARSIAVEQWRKAANRATCAPLALERDRGEGGKARSAYFGGGWAVAFDLPDLRSAYGYAGVGSLPGDDKPPREHRARLAAQWPLFRDVPTLPQPAFAGYGLEGAEAYPSGNPQGLGRNSTAYLRIGGSSCDYNVWSRLGRAHLEYLLGHLRVIESR